MFKCLFFNVNLQIEKKKLLGVEKSINDIFEVILKFLIFKKYFVK